MNIQKLQSALNPGVFVSTKSEMIEEQKSWSDFDSSKNIDFTGSELWITTDNSASPEGYSCADDVPDDYFHGGENISDVNAKLIATFIIHSDVGITPVSNRHGCYCDKLAEFGVEVDSIDEARDMANFLIDNVKFAFNVSFNIPNHQNHNLRSDAIIGSIRFTKKVNQ